jgi:glutathione synthase/RimK-type ligase-like ATP-grasp enzyme
MLVCLASNRNCGIEKDWINAFKKRNIDYFYVDLNSSNWFELITSRNFDFMIVAPNGNLSYLKQQFDERLYIIKNQLRFKIYPQYEGLLIYENKRLLSYWLMANNIPHPKTDVFYDFNEAVQFLKKCTYPIMAKSSIGAAGSGVHVLKDYSSAKKLTNKTFKGKGFPRRYGPNFNKKDVYKRILSRITDLDFVKSKINYYRKVKSDRDCYSILFQEFVPHVYEWKNVRIGDSFFAHKKLVKNFSASGTGIKDFADPPESLLNFIKEITDRQSLNSLSIDVFEVGQDRYLVNEVQTYFGQPYEYLMAVNNVRGRYLRRNEAWVFEAGDFNTNHSCDLRLDHAIDLYSNGKL